MNGALRNVLGLAAIVYASVSSPALAENDKCDIHSNIVYNIGIAEYNNGYLKGGGFIIIDSFDIS